MDDWESALAWSLPLSVILLLLYFRLLVAPIPLLVSVLLTDEGGCEPKGHTHMRLCSHAVVPCLFRSRLPGRPAATDTDLDRLNRDSRRVWFLCALSAGKIALPLNGCCASTNPPGLSQSSAAPVALECRC